MFEKIIEYQNLDIRRNALIRDLDNLKEKDEVDKVANLIKDNQNRLAEIDLEAKNTIAIYSKCEADFRKLKEEIDRISSSNMSSDDKEKWANKEDVLDKQFSTIERNLSVQVENVSNIIKQFEACKNNIVKYKNKYLESKEKYNEERKKYLPKLEVITKELEKLEKEVDKKLLQRYKQLKQDKIFPVFVAVNNNSCGGCSMEFSSAHMTKLKQDGYLECEHCRRINYNN